MLHCVYGMFHLARAAGARTPGSSGAYHTFSAITDLVVLPLYAYGALSVRNNGAAWTTLLADQWPLEYFLPATYYTLIGAGGAHVLSLAISCWLALMFRRIHKMPPDMNPLESHLTARASHKRNKSSVTTTSTYADSIEKRYSTPIEERRRSGQPYEDLSRPPTVPFMHTRQGSETSLRSNIRTRDSRADLPARQYQIPPSNTSPRHSGASELSFNSKRMSGGPAGPAKLTSSRNSYAQLPLDDSVDNNRTISRPTTGTSTRPGTNSTYRTSYTSQTSASVPAGLPREPRFTEAWYASESLVSRTQAHLNRAQALNQLTGNKNAASTSPSKAYAPLEQRYDDDDDDNGVSDDEENDENDENDLSRPHPLRSNPTSPAASPRPKSSFHNGSVADLHRNSPLSEIALNDRRASGTRDIADEMMMLGGAQTRTVSRKSSIQPETGFYSKAYGSLKPATPPVMLPVPGGGRQVSSGTDYGEAAGRGFGGRFSVFGRRNVSGKVAEEGRGRWSQD